MTVGVVVRPDQVTLGVLIDAVPRDAVDDAIAACGVRERRSDGKLPAHVITYLTPALTLFPDDDYEEVATKVTGSLDRFGLLERGMVGADRQCHHPGPETLGARDVCRVVRADRGTGRRAGGVAGAAAGFGCRAGVVPARVAAGLDRSEYTPVVRRLCCLRGVS